MDTVIYIFTHTVLFAFKSGKRFNVRLALTTWMGCFLVSLGHSPAYHTLLAIPLKALKNSPSSFKVMLPVGLLGPAPSPVFYGQWQ